MAKAGVIEALNESIRRGRMTFLGYITLANGPEAEEEHPGRGDGLGYVEIPVGLCNHCGGIFRWEQAHRIKHWRRCCR